MKRVYVIEVEYIEENSKTVGTVNISNEAYNEYQDAVSFILKRGDRPIRTDNGFVFESDKIRYLIHDIVVK